MLRHGVRRKAWVVVLLVSVGCSAAQKSPTPPPAPPAPTSANVGQTTIVAIQPSAPQQCCPKMTLPEFLGFKGMFKAIGGAGAHLFSRLFRATNLTGRFPALQPQPPLLPLTDPANMAPDAPPVVQAAAEAKQEEDKAGQKIMALRYLATLGCGGCYDKIEDALLEALNDCTETVRYEAALALKGNSSQGRGKCKYCSSGSCCSAKVRKKLQELADKTDAMGEYLETSERVRRVARLALDQCGGPPPDSPTEVPTEGPQPTPAATASRGPAASGARSSAWVADIALIAYQQTAPRKGGEDVILAQVNGEAIYDHEVSPRVEQRLVELRDAGKVLSAEEVQQLLRKELQRVIDVKLVLQVARRDLKPEVTAASVDDEEATAELDLVEVEKWLSEHIEVPDHVSILELTQEYAAQKQRFGEAPRVRWERITADVRQFASREEAYATLAAVRARAVGQPDVAPPANRSLLQIETHSWTMPADVKSPLVSRTLFALPVGKLSPILDEKDRLHVVRVLEHRGGGAKPFQDVVDVLRQDVLARRQEDAERQFVENLRSSAQIWTVFDSGTNVAPGDAAVRPASGAQQP
ncbi:MAG: peptidylprolyl isomerase [Pirellulales bacterium]